MQSSEDPSQGLTARRLGPALGAPVALGCSELSTQISNAHSPEEVAESETCTVSSMGVTEPWLES